jgi:hypothetical protein
MTTGQAGHADALVVFGITGNLARVMTFRFGAATLVAGHSGWHDQWVGS